MCYKHDDIVYEMKMDQICEQMEELVLDAFLSALNNIRKRTMLFSKQQEQKDEIPF
jgi:hypothetical protein